MPHLTCEKKVTHAGRPAIERWYLVGDFNGKIPGPDGLPIILGFTQVIQEIIYTDKKDGQIIHGTRHENLYPIITLNEKYTKPINLKAELGL